MDSTITISKRRCVKSSIICIVIAFIGLALLFFPNVPLQIVGVLIIMAAVITYFSSCKEWCVMPQNTSLKLHSLYFTQEDSLSVKQMLNDRDFTSILKLKRIDKSPIRLDIYASKSHSLNLCQLCTYVPYRYSPVTEFIVLPADTAAILCSKQRS